MTTLEKNHLEIAKSIVNRLPQFCYEAEIYNYEDFYKEPELFKYWVKLSLQEFNVLVNSKFINKDVLNNLLQKLEK